MMYFRRSFCCIESLGEEVPVNRFLFLSSAFDCNYNPLSVIIMIDTALTTTKCSRIEIRPPLNPSWPLWRISRFVYLDGCKQKSGCSSQRLNIHSRGSVCLSDELLQLVARRCFNAALKKKFHKYFNQWHSR